jgi:hypothetical protein
MAPRKRPRNDVTGEFIRAGREYPPLIMADDSEGENNGVPFGLLMWGQAGVYNAVDDRLVITGLSDSMIGVVRPAAITFGAGLAVTVPAGWLGIASCQDGTSAVVGSRQTHTLTETAGPATGQRTDHVWVDTFPDDGRWELRLVPQGQTVGRPGMSLGRVIVGAGQNQASQFTFDRLVPTIGRHADAISTPEPGHGGTGWVSMTPDYPIAPTSMRPHALFRVSAYGKGRLGAAANQVFFRMALTSSPIIAIATAGWIAPRERFDWECEAQQQVITPHGTPVIENRVRSMVKVTVTRWTDQAETAQAGNTSPPRSVSAVRTAWGTDSNLALGWQNIQIRARWGSLSSGQLIRAMGSTYESFESYHE